MPTPLSEEQLTVFEETLTMMKRFRDAFGDGVSESLIAEIHAARHLGLMLLLVMVHGIRSSIVLQQRKM